MEDIGYNYRQKEKLTGLVLGKVLWQLSSSGDHQLFVDRRQC